MPTLADIYSAANSFKRRLSDAAANPGASFQQMLGYANDRAVNLRDLSRQAADETIAARDPFVNGPANQALDEALRGAYGPVGMTVIPFGKTRNITVPTGQDVAAVNPVEVRARQAIDDLVNHAKYFGVDSPIDHTKMPIGGVMAHLDDYLGRSQTVAGLPDAAKESLRNLWYKAENAANAYKRVYGENKLMGKMEEAANDTTKRFKADEKKLAKQLKKGELSQEEYDNLIAYNRKYFPEE